MNKLALALALVVLSNCSTIAATSRAMILCGLPGDADHQEQFMESVTKIHASLTERFGFSDSNIRVYLGRSEDSPQPSELKSDGRGTREDIADAARWLTQETKPEDSAWVFVIGHSYFNDRTVYLNIPDRDITHREFCSAFKKLGGKSRFFICAPVSGYFIKGLSAPGRIVVSSTEPDLETNGCIYHTALAMTMAEITTDAQFDIDKNGTVSLFDLYVKSTQHLSDLYLNNEPPLIATEHPHLDDNGDGRGSELQIDYLTIEQGGRSDARRKNRVRQFKDGKVAATTELPFGAALPE